VYDGRVCIAIQQNTLISMCFHCGVAHAMVANGSETQLTEEVVQCPRVKKQAWSELGNMYSRISAAHIITVCGEAGAMDSDIGSTMDRFANSSKLKRAHFAN
jgi:hypothetical protein